MFLVCRSFLSELYIFPFPPAVENLGEEVFQGCSLESAWHFSFADLKFFLCFIFESLSVTCCHEGLFLVISIWACRALNLVIHVFLQIKELSAIISLNLFHVPLILSSLTLKYLFDGISNVAELDFILIPLKTELGCN